MSSNRKCQERAKTIECKYVHEVYSSQALSYNDLCDGPWPEIKSFLFSLQPGSFVADVGCGNGKYLTVRKDVVVHGVDICRELCQLAYERHKTVTIANSLNLPYRSSTMDAVISVGVLHHFASFERRLQSLKELSRILKPGGQILIYVWAWEQKQRKFGSQDVLIPWTAEKYKREEINDYGNQNIQTQSITMKRTFFQRNNCLQQLGLNNFCNNDTKNMKENLIFSNGTVRVCPISGDEDHVRVKLDNSSFINSINNFTAEIKEKLQRLSFANRRRLPSGDEKEFAESNSTGNDNSYDPDDSKSHETSVNCSVDLWGETDLQKGSFKRFYHVFIKDELLELVQCVRRLKVLTQYYDHGNWVIKAEKRKGPK